MRSASFVRWRKSKGVDETLATSPVGMRCSSTGVYESAETETAWLSTVSSIPLRASPATCAAAASVCPLRLKYECEARLMGVGCDASNASNVTASSPSASAYSTVTSTFPGYPSSPSFEVCLSLTLFDVGVPTTLHTCLSNPRFPPCRWFLPLSFLTSLYCFPSSVNSPFAMRLATRPTTTPKYGALHALSRYMSGLSCPSTTSSTTPSASRQSSFVTAAPAFVT
mmetsp:Transcript_11217/g.28417  ORF Transcript_11217/g.28417 Transcript_11217/m.28417 type:complete len:225 (+) Transcript_11217:363-1037(+)